MLSKKLEIKKVGKRITYKFLRDIILDENLTDSDTIILNTKNLDDIILEYLDTYHTSMTFPHLLLGVLVREAEGESIPMNKIGILKNDDESIRESEDSGFDFYNGEVVYRCAWCGNITNKNGKVLGSFDRKKAIHYIKTHENAIVKKTHGKCCPKGYN